MKGRVLTGDRPTGRLHLGHYVGSLENRVRLQAQHECFFIIADYHVLTTRLQDLQETRNNVREMVLDYLSVGIDPDRSTIYLQSLVPEVAELHLLFSMLISVPRLQRVPTLKDTMRDLRIETASYGLLGYPVLQAADILMARATLVPVGRDQLPHLEITREIARRFDDLYSPVFPEPQAVTTGPTLVGTDGKAKMSKSLGNAIFLSDDPVAVEKKVMGMYTDPTRKRATDPGHVEGNPVFSYLDHFDPDKEDVEDLKRRYEGGKVGDVAVKKRLARVLNAFLQPIREQRARLENRPGLVEEIIADGSRKARAEAQETLMLAKRAMGLEFFR